MNGIKDYYIKYGSLKGVYVSKAFEDGKIAELVELKKYLIDSFSKNPKYRGKILEGINAIDSYLLPEYSRLMNIFLDKVSKLSESEQVSIKKTLNLNSLKENDILYLKKLL